MDRTRQPSPQPNLGARVLGFPWRFWVIAVVTGLLAGLAAGLLMMLLRAVQHLAWSYHAGLFELAVQATPSARRVAVLAVAGAIAGIGGLALRHAVGGHASELAAAIWFHSGRLPMLYTCSRAVLSIVLVALGASLGREGAPKQIGAAIASTLCRRLTLSPAQCRLLAACGAGAGMAAVYNLPVGGALFALEILLGTVSLALVLPALVTSAIATAVSHIMLPDQPTYSIAALTATPDDLYWAILFGPVAGFASAFYVRLIAWAERRKPRGWRRGIMPMGALTVLGVLAIPLPELLGNGKDVVLQAMLGELSLRLLCLLLLLKPLVTALCLGSGAPGGLFTPSLAFGALLGGTCGRLWSFSFPAISPAHAAVFGAGAVLAATTQAPISAIVMLLELVHGISGVTLPLLAATICAVFVARRVEKRTVYSGRVRRGILAATSPFFGGWTPLFPVLSPGARSVSAAAPLLEIFRQGSSGSRLYVLDENGILIGELPTGRILAGSAIGAPLETTTAADIVRPTRRLDAKTPPEMIAAMLREDERGEIPIVDGLSGKLVGVAVRPQT